MASVQNFAVTAGEDQTLTMTARDGTGTVIDLTSAGITWRVMGRSGNTITSKTGTALVAASGTFTVSLTDADTSGFKDGNYTHEALVTVSGVTTKGVSGRLRVSGQKAQIGVTSVSVIESNVSNYDNVAGVTAATISSSVSWIRTAGYYVAGDGGGALYKRSSTQPSHTAYITSNSSGSYWVIAETDINILMLGAKADGTTDNQAVLQGAINYISSLGGGVLHVPEGSYAIASSVTLKNYVHIEGDGEGSSLVWTGGSTAMFTSSSSDVLLYMGVRDLFIDSGVATKLFELYGAYRCAFRDLFLDGNNATAFALDVRADSSGGTNPSGNRNSAFNTFENILHDGTVGTFIRLIGLAGTPQVVTLNNFNDVYANDVRVRGFDFAKWCDNNTFGGKARVNLTANSAIGVEHNSDTPGSNLGVYANNFYDLAVDTFGSYTGRIGIKMGYTKFNVVNMYFNEPAAEGGTLSVTSDTLSYDIGHIQTSTNFIDRLIRGRLYLENDSDAIRIATNDGTKLWGINVDSSTGDLRLTRVSGSGVARLSNLKVVSAVGFYNTSPVAQQTVTGSRAANAALASLLTALAASGLIVDSSTA